MFCNELTLNFVHRSEFQIKSLPNTERHGPKVCAELFFARVYIYLDEDCNASRNKDIVGISYYFHCRYIFTFTPLSVLEALQGSHGVCYHFFQHFLNLCFCIAEAVIKCFSLCHTITETADEGQLVPNMLAFQANSYAYAYEVGPKLHKPSSCLSDEREV